MPLTEQNACCRNDHLHNHIVAAVQAAFEKNGRAEPIFPEPPPIAVARRQDCEP